jgi:hypothetical protein
VPGCVYGTAAGFHDLPGDGDICRPGHRAQEGNGSSGLDLGLKGLKVERDALGAAHRVNRVGVPACRETSGEKDGDGESVSANHHRGSLSIGYSLLIDPS